MILLVNDDGIDAPGLRILYQALRRKTKQAVIAVAPSTQHSGQSHAITLHRGLSVHAIHEDNFFGFTIDGTPCDCVKMAIKIICQQTPQLVVSGINAGPNVGRSLFYSGTVAAALEAAVEGIPAIAVSQDNPEQESTHDQQFHDSALFTAELAHACLRRNDLRGSVLNINTPATDKSQWQELADVHHGLSGFNESYQAIRGTADHVSWHLQGTWHEREEDAGSDAYMLRLGHPTMTFLTPDFNSIHRDQHTHISARINSVSKRWMQNIKKSDTL